MGGGYSVSAQGQSRTVYTRIFSPLLYQLSYLGVGRSSNTGELFPQDAPLANPFGVRIIPWCANDRAGGHSRRRAGHRVGRRIRLGFRTRFRGLVRDYGFPRGTTVVSLQSFRLRP